MIIFYLLFRIKDQNSSSSQNANYALETLPSISTNMNSNLSSINGIPCFTADESKNNLFVSNILSVAASNNLLMADVISDMQTAGGPEDQVGIIFEDSDSSGSNTRIKSSDTDDDSYTVNKLKPMESLDVDDILDVDALVTDDGYGKKKVIDNNAISGEHSSLDLEGIRDVQKKKLILGISEEKEAETDGNTLIAINVNNIINDGEKDDGDYY